MINRNSDYCLAEMLGGEREQMGRNDDVAARAGESACLDKRAGLPWNSSRTVAHD